MKKLGKKQPGEQELETYMATCHSLPERVDPLTFWIEQENVYPLLATLAMEVLTIPASLNEFFQLLVSRVVENETDCPTNI